VGVTGGTAALTDFRVTTVRLAGCGFASLSQGGSLIVSDSSLTEITRLSGNGSIVCGSVETDAVLTVMGGTLSEIC
jgi:hypothetical protein